MKSALNLVFTQIRIYLFSCSLFFAPEGALRVKNRGLFPVPYRSPQKAVRGEQQLCGIYAWDLSEENDHSKPSLPSITEGLGMARTGIFQISLLCIFSFVPGGGLTPLNHSWRFFFPSDGSSKNYLISLQSASLIGQLRKTARG